MRCRIASPYPCQGRRHVADADGMRRHGNAGEPTFSSRGSPDESAFAREARMRLPGLLSSPQPEFSTSHRFMSGYRQSRVRIRPVLVSGRTRDVRVT